MKLSTSSNKCRMNSAPCCRAYLTSAAELNPLTTNLVACSWFLALYRVLQPRGLSDDEIGDLVYRVAEEWVTSSPRWIGRVQVLLIKTPLLRMIFGRISRQSQQRKYPGDFVVHFVPGDGRNFDFGLDFTGCAIHQFFQAEQAGHFAKYMCRIDYLTTGYKGIELIRTGTIANGADKCDFRYRMAGSPKQQPAATPQARGLWDESRIEKAREENHDISESA